MKYSKVDLLKVLQTPLSGLMLVKEELTDENPLRIYAEVLIAYLSGQVSQLILLNDQIQKGDNPVLKSLVKTRLAIREKTVTYDLIAELEKVSQNNSDWRGESLIIAGFASETIGAYKQAKDFYYESFQNFESINAKIKSLKALHNYISASSKIETERAYFAEFHLIYRKAKALRDTDVAGTALTNLAREFQKIKAYKSALKYACRAILFLQQTAGTYHHHMALLNRCHILCDLGRFHEANEDFEIIHRSSYLEVKAGAKSLEEIMTKAKQGTATRADNHPTWLERLAEEQNSGDSLSDLEDRILALLSSKPRDKYMLIKDLYGEKIAFEAAENRLKNLLNRLRKKMPGKIIFDNGIYKLADGVEIKIG